MEIYWKIIGGTLIAVVLGLSLHKDMSVLLTTAVCAMGTLAALEYLKPVLKLLWQIESLASLPGESLQIILKTMGICLIGEIAGMVCTDAGNGSMARVVRILSYFAVIWISIPLFESVLSVLQQILGEV